MPHREHHESLDQIGSKRRDHPRERGAPVVANEDDLLAAERVDDRDDITHEVMHLVVIDIAWFVALAASAQVRDGHAKTGVYEQRRDVVPKSGGIGPTVKEQRRGAFALEEDPQTDVVMTNRESVHLVTVHGGTRTSG